MPLSAFSLLEAPIFVEDTVNQCVYTVEIEANFVDTFIIL